MAFIEALQIYLVIAAGLTWTTYITLYKPAIKIVEETLESSTRFTGLVGFIIYTVIGVIFAPGLLILFFANDNEMIVNKLAAEILFQYEIVEEDDDDE